MEHHCVLDSEEEDGGKSRPKTDYEIEKEIRSEYENMEDHAMIILEQRKAELYNLVVRNLKNQLSTKMLTIKETPQNIVKRL